jgi:hypothetical protein
MSATGTLTFGQPPKARLRTAIAPGSSPGAYGRGPPGAARAGRDAARSGVVNGTLWPGRARVRLLRHRCGQTALDKDLS